MYCNKCGTQLEATAKFCAECGNAMSKGGKSAVRKKSKVLPVIAVVAALGVAAIAFFLVTQEFDFGGSYTPAVADGYTVSDAEQTEAEVPYADIVAREVAAAMEELLAELAASSSDDRQDDSPTESTPADREDDSPPEPAPDDLQDDDSPPEPTPTAPPIDRPFTREDVIGVWYFWTPIVYDWWDIDDISSVETAEFTADGRFFTRTESLDGNVSTFDNGNTWRLSDDGRTLHVQHPTDYWMEWDYHIVDGELRESIPHMDWDNIYRRDSLFLALHQLTDEELYWHNFNVAVETRRERMEEMANQQILGKWIYDLVYLHFYEDGSGIVDFPPFGGHPASQETFRWKIDGVIVHDGPICARTADGLYGIIVFYDTDMWMSALPEWMFHFGNRSGGSVKFRPIGGSYWLLTRNVDFRNTPLSNQVFSDFVDFLSFIKDPMKAILKTMG